MSPEVKRRNPEGVQILDTNSYNIFKHSEKWINSEKSSNLDHT